MQTMQASLGATKIVEFKNTIDSDGMAHDELPHQNLHCLPSSF